MPRKRQRVESPKSVDVENQPWFGLKKVTSMLRSTVFGSAPADTTERCFSTWNHASAYNGASVVYATDETLGSAESMLKFDSPSGWWTRRRRSTGQEFAIIELAGSVRVDAVYLQLGPRSERPPFISCGF
ncbi:MAG: hypothetical protein KVP17_003948 [Porospora cf. gigantea B]|uniref:uncharacterized protein n=1 Tax=Porospora cf. gigantea B TaxID=2853592 RepID=UPI0035718C75|nr:MAG: hypothetical protein KVP17_003948 [Porospora cf. gigantea B]